MAARSVLVVNDEPGMVQFIAAVLAKDGYDVQTATTAEEALRYEGRPDVVLTDVVMPEMNGPELAEQMRKRHPGIRVLFMSGYDEGRLGQCGAFRRGYRTILKPFTPDGLLDTVATLLEEPAAD